MRLSRFPAALRNMSKNLLGARLSLKQYRYSVALFVAVHWNILNLLVADDDNGALIITVVTPTIAAVLNRRRNVIGIYLMRLWIQFLLRSS